MVLFVPFLHALIHRHGQYDLNSSDHGLTALGREQAAITAQRIAALAASDAAVNDHYGRRPVRLLRVVHSDVTRAAETAAIISKALPPDVAVEVDTLLAEGYPCIPEPAGRVDVCPSWCVFLRLFILTRAFRNAVMHVGSLRGVGSHRSRVQKIL